MNDASDFTSHGYQTLQELGHNSLGGRVTYLAQNCQTREKVVIKQFQFATGTSTWSEYDSYRQEIKVLKSLNHPGIPRYLDSFQTADGFCMVQEYIDAPSAATRRSWTPEQIKAIALSTLEILVYLQSRHPSIIHRDIKPENILIDDNLNVYLVDFGFARLGGGDIAASSVVKGTMGFMPPEQLFNRRLTNASDLYALGATLICLLTGIKSADIGSLIDSDYCIHFRHLIPPQKRGWLNWLERMVEPKVGNRFANAADALEILKPLNVSRLPRVRLEHKKLTFKAKEWGEKVSQTIEITNPVPETILSGRWEVSPHPSDPPHTPYDHPYISFTPPKFQVNQITCTVTVDTRQLLMGETYQRQILLRTNSDPEVYPVDILIETATVRKMRSFLSISLPRVFILILSVTFGFFLFDFTVHFLHPFFLFFTGDDRFSVMAIIFVLFGVFFIEETICQSRYNGGANGEFEVHRFREVSKVIFGGLLGGFIGYIVAFKIADPIGGLFVGLLLGSKITVSVFKNNLPFSFVALSVMTTLLFSTLSVIHRGSPITTGLFMLIVFLPFAHIIIYCFSQITRSIFRLFLISRKPKYIAEKYYAYVALSSILFGISLGSLLRLVANGLPGTSGVTSIETIAVFLSAILAISAILIPLLNLIILQHLRTLKQYRKLRPTLIEP